MSRPGDLWRDKMPETEDVLWFARPDQGYIPPGYGWAYKAVIVLIITLWLTSPWVDETVKDYWTALFCVEGFASALYIDGYLRAQSIHAASTQYAWKISKSIKSRHLEFVRFLNFSKSRGAIVFERHPFFSFGYLSDPDVALQALNKAREAST